MTPIPKGVFYLAVLNEPGTPATVRYNNHMIEIIPESPNAEAADSVRHTLEQAYDEVRALLPELPESMNIWLDNSVLISETGDGGFAYAPNTITIAYDMDFADKEAQQRSLRATIFHEAFHIMQGHTHEEPRAAYSTALDSALYEGAATAFEREYAGSKPLWGEYGVASDELLAQWREELQKIAINDYLNPDTGLWQQWAAYDPSDNQRWKLYKTGTWLVDQYLNTTNQNVLAIVHTPAEAILRSK